MRDGRPWGLDGPEFLVLYAVALAAVCCLVVFLRGVARGREFRSDDHVQLGTYERAYLNGGADRVADTALAGLLEAAAVRTSRRHDLAVVKPGKARDEHQQLVLDRIQRSDRTVAHVRRSVRQRGQCAALLRSLRERGLLAPPLLSGIVLGARLLIPLLAAVGLARLITGVEQGYPVGFLLLELVATWGAWAVFRETCPHPPATWLGEAVKLGDPVPEDRGDAAGKHRRFRRFDRSHAQRFHQDAATKVAVGGLRAYPDSMVARLLAPPKSSGGGAGGVAAGGGGGGGCGGGGA